MLIRRATLLDGTTTDIRVSDQIDEMGDGLIAERGEGVLFAGGGTVPENLMITHIGTAQAGADLLKMDIPRSAFEPGQWMYEALGLRDTWTSRLVRTVSWSPID